MTDGMKSFDEVFKKEDIFENQVQFKDVLDKEGILHKVETKKGEEYVISCLNMTIDGKKDVWVTTTSNVVLQQIEKILKMDPSPLPLKCTLIKKDKYYKIK